MNNKIEHTKNDITEFVSSIITNIDGNVLILKRGQHLKLDPGKFDMCSGHMKQGEAPMQAMYREMQEEIGIMPHNITKMELLGNIPTPHIKFPGTTTHIYHVQINLSIEQINRQIEQTIDREMDYGMYLKNIEELRLLQKRTDSFRIKSTNELEEIYCLLEKKLLDRKELESKCEEK